MVVTLEGLSGIALRIGSNVPVPSHMAIGSGSGTATTANTGLIVELDRNSLSSTDFTTIRKAIFTVDFSSIEMSGLTVTEFGIFTISSGGKLWSRESFPSVAFTGVEELQVEVTYEVF
jgi:hypothetical protein